MILNFDLCPADCHSVVGEKTEQQFT